MAEEKLSAVKPIGGKVSTDTNSPEHKAEQEAYQTYKNSLNALNNVHNEETALERRRILVRYKPHFAKVFEMLGYPI